MKGGVLAAATTLGCVVSGSAGLAAAAASGSTPLAPHAAAASSAPRHPAAFVGRPGLPWVGRHQQQQQQQQRRRRREAGSRIGGSFGSGAAASAAAPRRRRLQLQMKVDVEVKTTPRSSGSEGGSGSGAALQRSGKAELPPAPRDGFRHQSLAQEPTDYSPYVKLGSKYQINLFGLWFAFWAGIVWGAVWAVILLFQKPLIEYLDKIDPMRRNVDWVAATWGRLSCLCTGLTPEITGVDNIPDGPAVYVANHVSWMDVPYSALLPVHCKYLAKSDLTKVPVLGDAMALSKHVLLDREDKRSQMEALTGALKILKKGTPIFVFPEGTRGPEGRLQPFKMGAFKVAAKAGVPIVPVSIAGTHLIMPREAIMPQRPSRGIAALHVHPPIPTAGRTEKELADLSFDIINEALSDEQRSLHPTEKDSDASPM